MTGWTAALDELEARLDAAAGHAAGHSLDDVRAAAPWSTPTVLGPPTHEEAARAAELLRRGDLVVAQLTQARDAVADELTAPARAPRPSPSMIDTRV